MVDKRETIYVIISISNKRLSPFFVSLILSFSLTYIFFFPHLFRFNFVVSERNMPILFCRHIWAELSLLFWTFLSGTFSQVGGGCTYTQCTPLRTRLGSPFYPGKHFAVNTIWLACLGKLGQMYSIDSQSIRERCN